MPDAGFEYDLEIGLRAEVTSVTANGVGLPIVTDSSSPVVKYVEHFSDYAQGEAAPVIEFKFFVGTMLESTAHAAVGVCRRSCTAGCPAPDTLVRESVTEGNGYFMPADFECVECITATTEVGTCE